MKMGETGLVSHHVRFSSPWAYCLLVWGVSRLALAGWGALLWALKVAPLPGAMTFYIDIPPIESGIAAPLLGSGCAGTRCTTCASPWLVTVRWT